MFTGIIHSTGKIHGTSRKAKGLLLTIRSGLKSVRLGESICVDGVCLTVIGKKKNKKGWDFKARVSEETLKKSALGSMNEGERVNLERSLRASDRLGGHFVQGHADATGRLVSVSPRGSSRLFTFSYPPFLEAFIVPKGSIAVNGVSLTIVDADAKSFSASVLPFTESNTSLAEKKPGDRVNLEADILAKIIAK